VEEIGIKLIKVIPIEEITGKIILEENVDNLYLITHACLYTLKYKQAKQTIKNLLKVFIDLIME